MSTPGYIGVGDTGRGSIDPSGDKDWYRVELVAGRTYVFDLEGADTSAGTLANPYLIGIYDSGGSLIPGTSNDDNGANRNSRVEYTPTQGGTHYVSAGAFGDNTGSYTLSMMEGGGPPRPSIELPDDMSTPGYIGVGDTGRGSIDPSGDKDWYRVELVAGRTYVFDLEGADTSAGTLADPYLIGIYDSGGSLIPGTSNDDNGENRNSRVEYTPTQGGTHYVSAGAFGDNTGSYTLSMMEGGGPPRPSGDFPDDMSTPGYIGVGDTGRGSIDPSGDKDWYRVELVAGRTYVFDLEGADTSAGTLADPYLIGIYDSGGSLIPGTSNDDNGENRNSRVEYTPTQGGTHYVSAGAFGDNTGSYTLSMMEGGGPPRPSGDFPDDMSTPGYIGVGDTGRGSIDPSGDKDWYRVELVAGRTYVFDLEGAGTSAGTLADPYLIGIYDSGGSLIPGTSNDDNGENRNSRVEYTPTQGGTHYVSAGAFGDNTGSYTLSMMEGGGPPRPSGDFPDDMSTPGYIGVGDTGRGSIDPSGDKDWYRVELVAGRTYVFDLEGADTSAGTLADPYLIGIYDSGGSLIPGTSNDDNGENRNSRVEYTPTQGGTHYVSAGAFGDNTGSYTLSMMEGGGPPRPSGDFPDDMSTPGYIGVGDTGRGSIDPSGDKDWYRVELVAGRTYVFDLEGADTSAGTLADPYLIGIYDSGGSLIPGTSNDDNGENRNSRVEYTPTQGGTHYVSAGAFGDNTGSYLIGFVDLTGAVVAPVDIDGVV